MTSNYKIFTSPSITDFNKSEWDECNKLGNVFTSYNFLHLLELSSSVHVDTGWQSLYIGAKKDSKLMAVMPTFIKSHSQGEFVFDHAWANAYTRMGMNYYPKLIVASPFTPVTGIRILTNVRQKELIKKEMLKFIKEYCIEKKISSLHINFCEESELKILNEENFLIRYGEQFHFSNNNYNNFDHFLESLSYKNRKNIIKERKSIKDMSVDIELIKGADLNQRLCEIMYKFYITTINKKSLSKQRKSHRLK